MEATKEDFMAPVTKPIFGKVVVEGIIKCLTGLHIGASQDNLEIGGLDKSVVRDPLTRKPYIPGSSLKGKMRSLLERREGLDFNCRMKIGGHWIRRHECPDTLCVVCRLFGSAGGKDQDNVTPRIIVRDGLLTDPSRDLLEEIETGLYLTEWKFENSLDRITSAANPRNLERVPAGGEFDLSMVYTVEADPHETQQDLQNIFSLMELIQDDFLGGHGSRGYGKVSFVIKQVMARRLDYYSAPNQEDRDLNQEVFKLDTKTATILDWKNEVSKITSVFK